MEIHLYRHAEPTVTPRERISGRDFTAWVERYNGAGSSALMGEDKPHGLVYASSLRRSIETAEVLGELIVIEPLLREADVPLLTFPPLRLRARFWLALARVLWLAGISKDCESYRETKQRVHTLVDELEHLPESHPRLALVGHGFINHLLTKECRNRGWRVRRRNRSNSYLGVTLLLRPPYRRVKPTA